MVAVRIVLRVTAVVAVAVVGAVMGIALAGGVSHVVGPIDARLSLHLSAAGGTKVEIPPLGSLRMDDHAGPLRLQVRAVQLRENDARRLLDDPASVETLPRQVSDDMRSAVLHLAVKSGLIGLVGGAILTALIYRRRRPVLIGVAGTAVLLAASASVAAATFKPARLAEPHYSGLLSQAPAVVGDARDIVANFDRYSRELARLTTNISRLYDVTSTLPSYEPDTSTIRALHVSDIHDNPEAFAVIEAIVKQFHVDVVLDTGDLTDHGTAAENRFAQLVGTVGAPYVYIRGNHDSLATEAAVVRTKGTIVLDGDTREVAGLRVFGAGDPRFTPDKTTRGDNVGTPELERFGQRVADELAATEPPPVDVALVHDPAVADQLFGTARLVLAGHVHHREHDTRDGTLLLVEGSTGGAGLRGLEHEQPTPLECTVLYFDRATRALQAYDEVTVGGLGTSSIRIDRHVVEQSGGRTLSSRSAIP